VAMHATRSSRPDDRTEEYATDAPTLDKRIGDMEERLALERAQVIAHVREFGGNVRRRMTSPTSLVFSAGMGFMAAELIGARSRFARNARRGASKRQRRAAGKSAVESIMKPLLALLRVGVLGFFAKQNKDLAQSVEETSGVDSSPGAEEMTLH